MTDELDPEMEALVDRAIDSLKRDQRWSYPFPQRSLDAGFLLGTAMLPGLPDGHAAMLRRMAARLYDPEKDCNKCGEPMLPGKALGQTWTGVGDFGPLDKVVTVSPGGPGRLVDCMKCVACGWSVSV